METGVVKHILLMRMRAGTTEAEVETVMAALRELASKIGGILAFEHGVNNSPESLSRGLTHVAVLSFASAATRDAYLPHPEHQKFGAWAGELGIVEEILVFDYVPQL